MNIQSGTCCGIHGLMLYLDSSSIGKRSLVPQREGNLGSRATDCRCHRARADDGAKKAGQMIAPGAPVTGHIGKSNRTGSAPDCDTPRFQSAVSRSAPTSG